jgi:hypothetical protein
MFQDLLRDMRMSVVTKMFTFRARDQRAVQATVSQGDELPAETAEESAKAKPVAKKKRRRRRRKR